MKRGFTIIELLVVVAIIGLLATISFVSLNATRAKARDARRISDVVQLTRVLELYYADHGEYPAPVTAWPSQCNPGSAATYAICRSTQGSADQWIPGLVPKYTNHLPHDPIDLDDHSVQNVWPDSYYGYARVDPFNVKIPGPPVVFTKDTQSYTIWYHLEQGGQEQDFNCNNAGYNYVTHEIYWTTHCVSKTKG